MIKIAICAACVGAICWAAAYAMGLSAENAKEAALIISVILGAIYSKEQEGPHA